MKNKKYKILKVTLEKMYLIPMYDEERTEINGWDMDTVKKDWFGDINRSHATRDTYEIGYSKKILHVEEHTELTIDEKGVDDVP